MEKSKTLLLFLGLLLSFSAGVGVMYLWQNYEESTLQPSPESEVPTGWKTYKNENVTFNFPSR